MKSYTDLEQSKKLAEILTIESADMHYNVVGDAVIGDYQSGMSSARSVAKAYKKNPDEFAKNVIPCWSLVALLDILKDKIIFGGNSPEGWFCCYTIKNPTKTLTIYRNSLVDACYEVILKLHELKLL